MKLYQRIAQLLSAIRNCEDSGNLEWLENHQDTIDALCKEHFPHGSGFDSGCKLEPESTPNRLIISANFHHMDENGFYDGWTTHTVIVSPDLCFDYVLRITGRDKRNIKDYISDTFYAVLSIDVE